MNYAKRWSTIKKDLINAVAIKSHKWRIKNLLELNGGQMLSVSYRDGRGKLQKVNGRLHVHKYEGSSSHEDNYLLPNEDHFFIFDVRTAKVERVFFEHVTRIALKGRVFHTIVII